MDQSIISPRRLTAYTGAIIRTSGRQHLKFEVDVVINSECHSVATVDNCIDTCLQTVDTRHNVTLCHTSPHLHQAQDAGLCLLLETCRGFHNDHVTRQLHIGKMYPLSTWAWECILRVISGNDVMGTNIVGIASVSGFGSEILRHDPSPVTVPVIIRAI